MTILCTHKGNNNDLSPMQRFFSNSTIFVTGGTGFLGILLLEKLLFSCPDICKIYMLVRGKKGKSVQTRLDELFEDVLFSRLKQKYPNFRKKIVPVEGDCELPELGLNAEDRTILKTEVDIVFHLAATVRFDEALKKASFINVRAVKDLVRLAREMPKLKSLVHVSTAFSNCIHHHIKEEVYPPVMDYQKLLHVIEGLPDDILNTITPRLLGEYPNTYSWTKQIGEDVVKQEGKRLPIGIHRPSIVTSTYMEPLRGWNNNFYGPVGVTVASAVGLLRTLELNLTAKSSQVPADLMINSLIASAWDVAETFQADNNGKVKVYTFESNQSSPLTWGAFTSKCLECGYKYYPVKNMWYMMLIPCRSHLGFVVLNFLLHKVPAILVDTVLCCIGKRPMLLQIYRKMDKVIGALRFFTTKDWVFDSEHLRLLQYKMSDKDKQIFPYDMEGFDWEDYFEYYARAFRVYLLKDPLDTLPEGHKRRNRLYWIHHFTMALIIIIFLWIVWTIFSLII